MKKNKELAFDAIICAIILLLTIVKPLGYPTIGPISATTVHIPVIIAIGYYKKISKAIMFGFFFGISSLIVNALMPNAFSVFFLNPLVSIVPRVAMGLTTYFVFKKLQDPIAVFIGSYVNTFFVLFALSIFYKSQIEALSINFWPFIKTIILTNALVEAIIATIIATSLIKYLKKRYN